MRLPVRTLVRFWRDSDQLVPIQFYEVPEGTPYVPHPGPFRDRLLAKPDEINWADGYIFPNVLGESYSAERRRVKGLPPPLIPVEPGDAPCGSAEQWLDGSRIDDNPPLVPGLGGWPVCCGAPPVTPVPPCPALQPIKFVVSGFPDDVHGCGHLNGEWWLCQNGGLWTGVETFVLDGVVSRWQLSITFAFGFQFLFMSIIPSGGFDVYVSVFLASEPWSWSDGKQITMVRGSLTTCPAGTSPAQMTAWIPFKVLTDEHTTPLTDEKGRLLTTEGWYLPPL